MSAPKYRLLFCLPTTALSGGVKNVLHRAAALAARGHDVSLFSFAGPPRWYDLRVPQIAARDFVDIDSSAYDFIAVSNAFMIPMLLPHVAPARPLYFALDYDAFHYGGGGTRYEDFICDDATVTAICRLPIPIITESLAVADLIRTRTGRPAAAVESAIDKSIFTPQPKRTPSERDRVLMIGNYLMPYKGMADGLRALEIVNRSRPIELVLATQEDRNREIFDRLPFPVEIHDRPLEREMPGIYGSVDLYCCTSWYEGLGLPPLEAFACGIPVVCTRNFGVAEYGVDRQNLLLCAPNDPQDLAETILCALSDEPLREQLRENGFATLEGRYEWPQSAAAFERKLQNIDQQYTAPPSVDPAAMRSMLAEMERAGNLTPIEVFRRYDELAREAAQLLEDATIAADRPTAMVQLQRLTRDLRPYLAEERAQYHRAFRSLFDLCSAAVAAGGDRRVVELLLRRLGSHDRNATKPLSAHARSVAHQ